METRIHVGARTVWVVIANVVLALVVLHLLRRSATVLSWVAVALLLAMALDPLVGWLARRRVPRGVAVLGIVVAALGLIGLFLATLLPPLVDQGEKLVAAAPALVDRVSDHDLFLWADRELGLLQKLKAELRAHAATAALPLLDAVRGVLTGLAGLVTILVLTTFMLIFGPPLVDRGLEWIHPAERERYRTLVHRIRSRVGAYVAGALVIASIGGLFSAVTLLLVGVPYVVPLGLVTALLGLVPFLGVVVAALLMVVTALAAVGVKAGVIVGVAFVVYQQVENHLLQPLVQRRTIDMNPLLIAGAMLVGTAAAGIWGALFALPAAGVLQVVLQDLLAARRRSWAPAPAEPPPRPLAPGGGDLLAGARH
jgi:predicted PurR-regulated permease PerM